MKDIFEWLPLIDKELSKKNIPIQLRPLSALAEIRKHFPPKGVLKQSEDTAVVRIDDPQYIEIQKWYSSKYENIQNDIISLKTAFCHDNYFFSMIFPSHRINDHEIVLQEALQLPQSINFSSVNYQEYLYSWSFNIDYFRGYRKAIADIPKDSYVSGLLNSAHIHLNDATNILIDMTSFSKATQLLRFATEIYLKFFVCNLTNGSDSTAKKYGHFLQKALSECKKLAPANIIFSEIGDQHDIDSYFPDVQDRYKHETSSRLRLWKMYKLTFAIAAAAVNDFTENSFFKLNRNKSSLTTQEFIDM
jgi:hypothetical protein